MIIQKLVDYGIQYRVPMLGESITWVGWDNLEFPIFSQFSQEKQHYALMFDKQLISAIAHQTHRQTIERLQELTEKFQLSWSRMPTRVEIEDLYTTNVTEHHIPYSNYKFEAINCQDYIVFEKIHEITDEGLKSIPLSVHMNSYWNRDQRYTQDDDTTISRETFYATNNNYGYIEGKLLERTDLGIHRRKTLFLMKGDGKCVAMRTRKPHLEKRDALIDSYVEVERDLQEQLSAFMHRVTLLESLSEEIFGEKENIEWPHLKELKRKYADMSKGA